MSEQLYKPNSHKYKEEQRQAAETEKKIEKVVKRPVKIKKQSGLSKVSDIFIAEDASKVKSYILVDVLIPAAKKAISDIVTNGIDMILYGETGRRNKKSGNVDYVSYRSYSERDRRDDGRSTNESPRTRFDYDNIVFATRAEAIGVLDSMDEVIKKYGFVTVADLYDMVELTHPYTAAKYGWTNLSTAKTVAVRDGYILKLPKAMAID